MDFLMMCKLKGLYQRLNKSVVNSKKKKGKPERNPIIISEEIQYTALYVFWTNIQTNKKIPAE